MSHGTRVYESLERLKAVHGDKLDLSGIPKGLLRCAVTTDTRVKLRLIAFRPYSEIPNRGYVELATIKQRKNKCHLTGMQPT